MSVIDLKFLRLYEKLTYILKKEYNIYMYKIANIIYVLIMINI